MTKHPCVFFLWVRSLNGPTPRVVFADPLDEPCIEDRLKHHVLAQHVLHPHQQTMTFRQLEAIYPPPKEACS